MKEAHKTYQAPNLFIAEFQHYANLLYMPKLVTLIPLITWLFYNLALMRHSWVWKTSSDTYKLHCQNHLELLLWMISTFLSILGFLFRQLLILSITARFSQWNRWVLPMSNLSSISLEHFFTKLVMLRKHFLKKLRIYLQIYWKQSSYGYSLKIFLEVYKRKRI